MGAALSVDRCVGLYEPCGDIAPSAYTPKRTSVNVTHHARVVPVSYPSSFSVVVLSKNFPSQPCRTTDVAIVSLLCDSLKLNRHAPCLRLTRVATRQLVTEDIGDDKFQLQQQQQQTAAKTPPPPPPTTTTSTLLQLQVGTNSH